MGGKPSSLSETTRRIVALDPGGTTGIAVYTGMGGKNGTWPLRSGFEAVFRFEQLGPEPHHLALWKFLTQLNPRVVVCERFQSRPNIGGNGTVNLDAKEYIGIARLYCVSTGKPFVEQQAAAAKGLWPNEKLKALNLWQPKKHAMDALRHLLYYITVVLKEEGALRALRRPPVDQSPLV